MSNNYPNWNLNTLLPEIGSDEYESLIGEYKKSIEKCWTLVDSKKQIESNFCEWLNQFLQAQNELLKLENSLGAFSYINYSVDTTNTKYINNMNRLEKMGLDSSRLGIAFKKILYQNRSQLNLFFEAYADFKNYKIILEEEIFEYEHQMSEAEELLAQEMQQTGGNAWSRLHEQIISTLADETGKTFNGLRNDAYSEDAQLRFESYKKEKSLLAANQVAFAACLNNLKGETVTLFQKRKYSSAIERALVSSRLSMSTLNALIESIKESLPMWRKYLQIKAKILRKTNSTVSKTAGTDSEKGIAWYDMFAPLTFAENSESKESLLTKQWSVEDAEKYIVAEYNSFSSDMGNFARNAFEKNWIDFPVHEGKVGGAYDEDFAWKHESRIMTNFTGCFSDIITLAHELGHAYHFSCMKGKDVCFFSYPMTLAETASTFAETIVKQDAIKSSEGTDKIKIIELDLSDTCQVLVDILSRFIFESNVFENRKETELNAEDFCKLMAEAQEESYGDGLNSERHEYMWAVKSHYYGTELDFYNFPYAFGQLFAAGLYSRFQKEGKEFAGTYAKILSRTGELSCEDLCKEAGFDITKKDFWKSGLKMYEEEIKILEEFANQL